MTEQQPEQTVEINIPLEGDKPITDRAESTSNPQETPQPQVEAKKEELFTENKEEPNPIGRPCEYCQRKEEIDRITREYIDQGKSEEKPKMLYINELAIRLGIYRDIVHDWRVKQKEDGSLEHEEFNRMIKELESIQELRLQQRTMGRYNPTGAIFLLKTKHKYIETEKKLLGNEEGEKLQIEFVEQKHLSDE